MHVSGKEFFKMRAQYSTITPPTGQVDRWEFLREELYAGLMV